MGPKPQCGEDHHQEEEDESGLCLIPQKKPCALACQPKCSEPIKADNHPNDEDDPICVGLARDVKRWCHRLEPGIGLLLRFFPDVSLARSAVPLFPALDGLKVLLLFLVGGCTEQCA